MGNSFYTTEELKTLGLKAFGKGVCISRNAKLYGAQHMQFGDNVRVDDFCILSGEISLGSHIHIAAGSMLFAGEAGIKIADFSTLSSRCAVYALTDDYSGATMTNPTVPNAYKNVTQAPVVIGRHVIVGTASTILPGVTLADGTAIGAHSMVQKSTDPFGIYAGIPAKHLKKRSRACETMAQKFTAEWGHAND